MKPTVLCQICGKLIELTDFNFDKHRVCGKKCHQEWDWRYSLGVMREEYRSDPATFLEVEQEDPKTCEDALRDAISDIDIPLFAVISHFGEAASAAEIMRKAGVPNMLEGRVLNLKVK